MRPAGFVRMSTPVPVVHVITRLELGGAQLNTLHTVARLDRARFAPQLVCGPGGMLDDEARALTDVPLHFVPSLVRPVHPFKDRAAAAAIADLLAAQARRGPVIVHTHSSKAGVIGRWASKAAGAGPVVHSIHGFGFDALGGSLSRRAALFMERRLAARTDAFISVSRFHVEEGRRLGLLGDRPAHVIRSGIDLADFGRADALRADTRAALGYGPEEPVVGMVGNFKPQKNPLEFVEIAARVAAARPATRFFFAGDGELRAEVEARASALGLSDTLTLLGWRRDVPALLGALDVSVLTSRWEGLPRVAPQAMAAGRPIVATAIDGTPEAVVDGRNGFLYPPGDVALATDRIVQLLDDRDLRRRFAAAGRAAVTEWDQDEMVRRQEALYTGLLASPRG